MMLQYKYEVETLREQQNIIVDDGGERDDRYEAEMQVGICLFTLQGLNSKIMACILYP